jgi:hypothetical protein
MAERFKRWKKNPHACCSRKLTEGMMVMNGNNSEWLQSVACGGNWKSYGK